MDERRLLMAQFLEHRHQLDTALEIEESCVEEEAEDLSQVMRDAAMYRLMSAIAVFVRFISTNATEDVEAFEELLEDLLRREVLSQEEYEMAIALILVFQAFCDADPEGADVLEAVHEALPLYAEQLQVLYTTMERVDTQGTAA